jgi:FkbM family methyltransferase
VFPKLAEPTRRLLANASATLTFLDVGARNGVIELAELAPFVDAYGFEPNAREFAKLESGETGTSLIGIPPPPYHSLRHIPYALGERDGRATLYVTRATGAAGLREPDLDRLREIVWKAKRFRRNLGDDYFEVVATEEVDVRMLKSFAADVGLESVDYLKVDVEGTEYEVLEGAGDLLGRTGVVRVEVCFIPFRIGQRLFSDVDLLLRGYGFDLLRYEILPAHVGYKVRTAPVTWGPAFGFPDRYGQPLQADAVYVNRNVVDHTRAVAQAAVLVDLNYIDEAAFVLERRGDTHHAALVELLRSYSDIRPQHRLMRFAADGLDLGRKVKHPVAAMKAWRGWREDRRREGYQPFERFRA